MMNSQVYEVGRKRIDPADTLRLIAATSVLVGIVFVLCGCTQQNDGSVFKVQTGEKTLLDIKKNPDEKVSIEVDVPKVNFKMKNNDDVTVQHTTVTEQTVTPAPVQVVPVQPAPQPVPGVPTTN